MGAQKAAETDTEIATSEITPEMISAGVAALELYLGSYPSFLLVQEVYIAMASLSWSSLPARKLPSSGAAGR